MKLLKVVVLAAALAGFGAAPALATTGTGDPGNPGYNKTVVKKKSAKKKVAVKKSSKKKLARAPKRPATPPTDGATPPGTGTPPGSTTSN
jgi:hypothetical protein